MNIKYKGLAEMNLEQFIIANTTILTMVLITTWIYLGYRIYKATRQRKLERQYLPLSVRDASPIPELTDTDSASEESNYWESDQEPERVVYVPPHLRAEQMAQRSQVYII